MTVMTESYLKRDPAKLPPADELMDQRTSRQALLQELGFRAVERWEQHDAQMLFLAGIMYPELTGRTETMWRRFLPTTVNNHVQYRHDAPPDEALQYIQTAQQLGCFDRIEIWTPEGNSCLALISRRLHVMQDKFAELSAMIDPIAVGVKKDLAGREHFFQIVRWGEALLSVAQIKWRVRSVRMRAAWLLVVLPVLAAVFAVAAFVDGVQHYGYFDTIMLAMFFAGMSFFGGLFLGLIGMIIEDMYSAWRQNKKYSRTR